jgi:uncharacterized protein (TIGR03545 family)
VFSYAVADIELMQMFMGQVLISDLSLEGLAFATPRKYSAAIAVKKEEEKSAAEKSQSSVNFDEFAALLPSAETLLGREPLQTDLLYRDLNDYVEEQKTNWQNIDEQLIDDKKIEAYSAEVKAISNEKIKSIDDFKQAKKRLDAVKNNIREDQKNLKAAKNLLQDNRKNFSEKLSALKAAPKQDLQNLKDKYQFNQGGALNISGLLFGSQVQDYSSMGLRYYKKIAPLLVSEEKEEKPKRDYKGRYVHFGKVNTADFWLKKGRLQASIVGGEYAVDIRNLSHQQSRTGFPTTVKINSTAVKNLKHLSVDILVDYRGEKRLEQLDYVLNDYQLSPLMISKSDDFALSLSSALVNSRGQFVHDKQGSRLTVDAMFKPAQFTAQADNSFVGEIAAAIEKISAFDVKLSSDNGIKGLKIRSDLDNQINQALKSVLKDKQAALEKALQQRLNAKLAEYLDDIGMPGAAFSEDQSIDQRLDELEGLLEAKVDSIQDEKKDELQDKLKSKMKKLF